MTSACDSTTHSSVASRWGDAQIEHKFRGLAEDLFGSRRCNELLQQLWLMEEIADVATLPPRVVIA